MSFPTPEKGVKDFEVWRWREYPGEWLRLTFEFETATEAMDEMAVLWDNGPAYVRNRITGEVIATNQQQLEAQAKEEK